MPFRQSVAEPKRLLSWRWLLLTVVGSPRIDVLPNYTAHSIGANDKIRRDSEPFICNDGDLVFSFDDRSNSRRSFDGSFVFQVTSHHFKKLLTLKKQAPVPDPAKARGKLVGPLQHASGIEIRGL
jgi:hypothetical protein